MTDNRTSFTGFNAFVATEQWGQSYSSGRGPALNGNGRDALGAGLRTAYAELLDAPLPERLLRLIEQLDASSRKSAR